MARFAAASLGFLALTTGACASIPTSPDEITIRATVRFVDVEGGCWRLDAVNGTSYDQIGLPSDFRTDGRQVVVTLRFPDDLGSFCLVGTVAKVVAIRDR